MENNQELQDMENDQESQNKKHSKQIILYVLGIVLIIGAMIYLGGIFKEYRDGEEEYDALHELVFEQEPEVTSADDKDSELSDEDEENYYRVSDEQVMRALGELKERNDDVIGWIAFDNMDLSYPIMQAEDNEYYLTRTFSGETNSSGSIFMEAANSSDFEDCHTIIYGHNMKNDSMFGKLKYYKNDGYYEDHQFFTIYTEDAVYRYQIFAYYDIEATGEVYTIGFEPNEEFQRFLNNIKRRSYYDTGVGVARQDKVITLSTCSSEGIRFVINAKRLR